MANGLIYLNSQSKNGAAKSNIFEKQKLYFWDIYSRQVKSLDRRRLA